MKNWLGQILERELASLEKEAERWSALEQQLQDFVEKLKQDPVDEGDIDAATREYLRRLGAAGLLAHVVPQQYGGAPGNAQGQPSAQAICLIRQWLARSSGALDTAFVMQGLGSFPLAIAGPEDLKAKIYPKVADGSMPCAFALTEPDAGSDVARMQTRAEACEGGVSLRGEKIFISNATIAGSYVLFAREGEVRDETGTEKAQYSAFWLPGDAEGLSVEAQSVIAPHPIGRVLLDGVFVPEAHRVGAPGQGLSIALGNLDQFRPTVGAAALGLADRAMHESVSHLKSRVQFGRPLAKQQGLRFALAELATEHIAAHLLVYRAAALRDAGRVQADQVAMAKLAATESAQRVIDRAVQNLGGRGVLVGEAVERLYREVRALRIYEGTSEIQKLVIARGLF